MRNYKLEMEAQEQIIIYKKEDFIKMREAGQLAASILDHIGDFIKPGVTTDEINLLCHDMIIKSGATPAPLNYKGFPKSICTSVNHVVCHGVPSKKKLLDGDIINIDVTVILDGWHGDTSRMFFVGIPSIKARRLISCTYEAMMLAIEQIKPGIELKLLGKTIQSYAEKNGFSVVRDYCGHGIGKVFHSLPNVLHFYDASDKVTLEPGMFFTVEPMINVGSYHTKTLSDGWTVVTKDKSLSAQFEHTIGVTENSYEIFTKSPKGLDFPKWNL